MIANSLLNLSYFIFGHFVIVHFERRPNNSIAGEVTLSHKSVGEISPQLSFTGTLDARKIAEIFLPDLL